MHFPWSLDTNPMPSYIDKSGRLHNLPDHLTDAQREDIIALCRYLTTRWILSIDFWLADENKDRPPKYVAAAQSSLGDDSIIVGPDWIDWALEHTIVFPDKEEILWQHSDAEGKVVTV